MPDKSYKLYKITNTINGKVYVGYTQKTLAQRFSQHKCRAITARKNTRLFNAIRKYGIKNFQIELVVESDNKQWILNVMEPHYIRFWNTQDSEIGYNMSSGGDCPIQSEETRKKLRAKKVSLETRQKISKSRLGSKNPYLAEYNRQNNKNRKQNQTGALEGKRDSKTGKIVGKE